MFESKKRTLVKTVTFRIISLILTLILVHVFVGDFKLTIIFGMTDILIKTMIYYVHERIWAKIKWENNDNKS